MTALVFADRHGNELLPLTKNRPLPLLPVRGKPLIEHTLDDLAAAEVNSTLLVVGDHGDAMREALGDGTRWNMRIEYIQSAPTETPTQLAKRFAARLPDKFLALRGDVYRSPSIPAFKNAARNILARQIEGRINGRPAQLYLCRDKDMELGALSWQPGTVVNEPKAHWRTVNLGSGGYSQISDITDFYLTNLDDLDGKIAALNDEAGLDERRFFAAKGAQIDPAQVMDGPVLLDAGSVVKPGTRLCGPLVIGKDAYIDADCFLHASVVMPGSYIPAGTQLHNAIVTSEIAFHFDGSVLKRFGDS